jgi:hypothetical protein
MCSAYEISCFDLSKNICLVTVWYVKKKKITNIFTLIVNITKQYWQEVKKMTTNLYIGDHVFNLESLVFGISCFDLSKNICFEHIIYLIFKNFKYIYFFLFLI